MGASAETEARAETAAGTGRQTGTGWAPERTGPQSCVSQGKKDVSFGQVWAFQVEEDVLKYEAASSWGVMVAPAGGWGHVCEQGVGDEHSGRGPDLEGSDSHAQELGLLVLHHQGPTLRGSEQGLLP